MPAEHFRRLIAELHPGVSTRQLAQAAGVAHNVLYYWLRPTTEIKGIPIADTVKELARIVGCDPALIVEAFAADSGTPLPRDSRPDPDHEWLIRTWERMSSDTREAFATAMVNTDAGELLRLYLNMSPEDRAGLDFWARKLGTIRDTSPRMEPQR